MAKQVEVIQATEARVSLATVWAGVQGTWDQLCAVLPPVDRSAQPVPPTATHVSGVVQLTSTSVGPLSTQFHWGAVPTVGGVAVVGDVVVGAAGGVVVGDVVVGAGGDRVVVVVGDVVVVGSLVGETPVVVVVVSGVDAPALTETGKATTMDVASNRVSPTVRQRRRVVAFSAVAAIRLSIL